MKVSELTNQLEKYKDEEIQFFILDKDGKMGKFSDFYSCDGRSVFEARNEQGIPCGVAIGIMNNKHSLGKE